MNGINLGRVLLGGLIAGLVLNIGESVLNMLFLGSEWEAAMRALNRPPVGGGAIGILVALGFALGITAVWLYAAIRPRYGAGFRTAVCAGLFVWTLAYAWPALSGMPMNVFPHRLFVISMLWGLFEVPIATVAGAWLYRE